MLAENGMVLGNIGPDQKNDIGFLEVLIRTGRAIAAKGPFVAGNRARHAQGRISVVIPGCESKLNQFPERIELFGHQLSGANDTEGVAAITLLSAAKFRNKGIERLIAADRNQFSVLAHERIPGAICGIERIVLRQSLGTELAEVHRVIRIAADADGSPTLHAKKHSTTDGTVAACSRDPTVRNLCGRGPPVLRVLGIGIFLVANVYPDLAQHV